MSQNRPVPCPAGNAPAGTKPVPCPKGSAPAGMRAVPCPKGSTPSGMRPVPCPTGKRAPAGRTATSPAAVAGAPAAGSAPAKKSRLVPILIGVVALLVLVFGVTTVQRQAATQQLHDRLQSQTWSTTDDGNVLTLDFDEDELDIEAKLPFYGRVPIASLDYKVTGPDAIEVTLADGSPKEIEVTQSGSSMTFDPPLLTEGSTEFWS